MKKISLSSVVSLVCLIASGQSLFVALQKDSFYFWGTSVGLKGEIIEHEDIYAYSYDTSGRLIQVRQPYLRDNYSYQGDTVVNVNKEEFNFPNGWKSYQRTKSIYYDGLKQSEFTEKEMGGSWKNLLLDEYIYNPSDQLILLNHYNWGNGEWEQTKKTEYIYEEGRLISEMVYSRNLSLNQFYFYYGYEYSYDESGNKILQIDWTPGIEWTPVPNTKRTWQYDENSRLLNFHMCSYSSLDECTNQLKSTFQFDDQLETTIGKHFNWVSNNWKYTSSTVKFKGPEIYSNHPDSILTYYYSSDTGQDFLSGKTYYNFLEIEGNRLYYSRKNFSYAEQTGWELKNLVEIWYTLPTANQSNESLKTIKSFEIYPNPCPANQKINLKFNQLDSVSENLEVLVFDLQGRLVSRHKINASTAQITSPNKAGVYNMVILINDELIAASKLVVN